VKPLDSQTVFSTAWFDVVAKTMRSGESPYYSLRLPDYVGVLAITEDQRILAVRQYRPAVERLTIELPAGLIDPGESPAETARRELLEETGYRAEEIQVLGELTTDTGRMSNRIWACFAPSVRKAASHESESGIETLTYTTKELREAIKAGHFNLSLHVAIVMLAVAQKAIAIF
jgi:ADP-ribose pyrophosphatase